MKVLHILGELRPSGMEVMLRIAKADWEKERIHPEILVAAQAVGPYASELKDAGYRIHHFGFSKTPSHFWRYVLFLRAHSFDVVHIHVERAMVYYGFLAWCAGASRIIKTQHGQFNFTGVLRYRRRWQRWLLRKLGVQFVSIGPSVSSTEWELFRNPTQVISNWFDTKKFRPSTIAQRDEARRKLSIEPSQLAIITVGNCSPIKNHGMLLEALAMAMRSGVNFVYLHIGLEEEQLAERRLALRLGLSARVRFLGWVPNPAEYLRAADLYVMCSTHEGLGNAALEAMGCGVPVLLTDVPGLRDLCGLDDGILWAQLTPRSLADGIHAAHQLTVRERVTLGTRMSSVVHQQFQPAAGVSAYAALYRGHCSADRTVRPRAYGESGCSTGASRQRAEASD